MKKQHHFVIRNGKLVPKSQDLQQQPQLKTQITYKQPTTSILLTGSPPDDKINILKATYDNQIQKLSEKIRTLQNQLHEKNLQLKNGRKCRCKHLSMKENIFDDELETDQSYQFNQKPILLTQISEISQKNQSFSHGFLTERSYYTVENQQKLNTKHLEKIQQKEGMFDTSALMKRLAHSENLVKNIKKFLQEPNENSQSIKNKMSEKFEQQNFDWQEFLDEVEQKNRQILSLLDRIVQEKDEEIEEICEYYEWVIRSIKKQKKRKRKQSQSLKNSKIGNFQEVRTSTQHQKYLNSEYFECMG